MAPIRLENVIKLKGQCHEIFCFWFFSWTSFPQASDYTIRAVSNFFKNSRRYSQLKVWHRCQRHRWQMEKTFKQKNFKNLVWTPLGSRVNKCIHFCLQVHFKVTAAWYCCQYLPPVSTTPVANLPPVLLIATGVVDTVGKFAAGINNASENGGKFATGVIDTGGAPWLTNISANFRKNSKRSKWNTLGLGGNWFMKKTRSKKSRDTVPLKCQQKNEKKKVPNQLGPVKVLLILAPMPVKLHNA